MQMKEHAERTYLEAVQMKKEEADMLNVKAQQEIATARQQCDVFYCKGQRDKVRAYNEALTSSNKKVRTALLGICEDHAIDAGTLVEPSLLVDGS